MLPVGIVGVVAVAFVVGGVAYNGVDDVAVGEALDVVGDSGDVYNDVDAVNLIGGSLAVRVVVIVSGVGVAVAAAACSWVHWRCRCCQWSWWH